MLQLLKEGLFFEELPETSKKLVLVLTISVPVTDDSKKVVRVLCIHYPVWFQEKQVKALLNSGSEVNAMSPIFAQKLGLHIWKINVKAQKIDGSTPKTFGMVIANF